MIWGGWDRSGKATLWWAEPRLLLKHLRLSHKSSRLLLSAGDHFRKIPSSRRLADSCQSSDTSSALDLFQPTSWRPLLQKLRSSCRPKKPS